MSHQHSVFGVPSLLSLFPCPPLRLLPLPGIPLLRGILLESAVLLFLRAAGLAAASPPSSGLSRLVVVEHQFACLVYFRLNDIFMSWCVLSNICIVHQISNLHVRSSRSTPTVSVLVVVVVSGSLSGPSGSPIGNKFSRAKVCVFLDVACKTAVVVVEALLSQRAADCLNGNRPSVHPLFVSMSSQGLSWDSLAGAPAEKAPSGTNTSSDNNSNKNSKKKQQQQQQ